MTDFLTFGAFFSLALTLLILGITAVKKVLAYRLTPAAHYYIWFILFFSFLIPFFPKVSFSNFSSNSSPVSSAVSAGSLALNSSNISIQDFAVNAGHYLPQVVPAILIFVWITGMFLMLSRIVYSFFKAQNIRKLTKPASIESLQQYEKMLGIKRSVPIRTCSRLQGPIIIGTFKPNICLPAFCGDDLKFILLHELVHYKHKDTLFNLLMHTLLAVNWFNPFVWFAQKQMEADRESFCDSCVLSLLDPQDRIQYGHAVINWTAGFCSSFVGMGSTKKQLYSRVQRIAAFQKQTSCRGLSLFIILFMLFAALLLVPSVHAFSSGMYQPEPQLNITEENLASYFGNYEGSFVLYDQKNDTYTIYNEKASRTRVSPNSTYKIYSGLLALEKGNITADNSARSWDGTEYEFKAWNQDQNLTSALQNSVNWYFQKLDQEAGRKTLEAFYDKIGYGNCDLTGNISQYWMESSLKISPIEQVMLLTDLYENNWGFADDTVSAVKEALKISQEKGRIFSGKTGTGMVDNRLINGWFIGSVQSSTNLYTFALNLQGKDGASGTKAADIAQEILKGKHLL